jgi:hypothetical protein
MAVIAEGITVGAKPLLGCAGTDVVSQGIMT